MSTFFKIELEEMHPGVVDMDAVYHFNCRWNDLFFADTQGAEYTLETDNENVLINGADVIVPYSVRKAGTKVTVKGVLNDYYKFEEEAEDTYVLDFEDLFSDEPSFFDDFDTYDESVWSEGFMVGRGFAGASAANSELILDVDDEVTGREISTSKTFKQAFGCFSAKMKLPKITNNSHSANCAFWLCSDIFEPDTVMFKRNTNPGVDPKKSTLHAGEIDIMEYSPAFGNNYAATIHCYGWQPGFEKQSGKCVPSKTNLREGYHVISLVWVPDKIFWYCDGILIRSYEGEYIQDAGKVPGAEMVLLLQNVSSRSTHNWLGRYGDTIGKIECRVDWVKVHSLKRK